MERLQGSVVVLLMLDGVATVTVFSVWLLRTMHYRRLIDALYEILEYTRFKTACEAREAYLAAGSGWRYSLEDFVYVLGCFERQHAATVRERTGCLCGSCEKEYALSFHIRRRDRRKKSRSAWLEAGELVPIRA
ncbi:MAG TPA: hypothetical protein VHC68_03580 [Candidatus Paceibacterota bacterium]|nr:hypothetical protein [Candidatus Paceibacterota bacterium]